MKKFGLIGYPLKNSFSQNYFNSKFLSLGLLQYEYHNFPFKNIAQLENLLATEPDLTGFNVTIPFKEAIIPYLTELDTSAREAGAVNCVKRVNSKLIGYNTDVYGFENSLLPLLVNTSNLKALVLGTGGAAKAVAYVLRKQSIPYTFVSRTPEADQYSYAELSAEIISTHKLIINCTPLGMFPDIDGKPPLPYNLLTPEHIAYDLIYLPVETRFLQHSREQGATTKNGLEMLHLQAEKSWEIWR